jgi:hypothetical protein
MPLSFTIHPGLTGERLLAARGPHKVGLHGPLASLAEFVPELAPLVTRVGGYNTLPPWLLWYLSLGAFTVDAATKAALNGMPFHMYMVDPGALGDELEIMLKVSGLTSGTPVGFAQLVKRLRGAVSSRPAAVLPLAAWLLVSGRREGESGAEAATRLLTGTDLDENQVQPPAMSELMWGQLFDASGRLSIAAMLEALVWPRIQLSERLAESSGFRMLFKLLAQRAFKDMVAEGKPVARALADGDLDWLGETELIEILVRELREIEPPLKLLAPQPSLAHMRRDFARW